MENQKIPLPRARNPYSLAVGFRAGRSLSARIKCFLRGMGGGGSIGSPTTKAPPTKRTTTKRTTTKNPKQTALSNVCGRAGSGAPSSMKGSTSAKFSKEVRIVKGREAKEGAWPWMVFLVAGEYSCGATLISKRSVLTAAHCTEGFRARSLTVGLGCHEIGDRGRHDCYDVESIRRIIDHPRYKDYRNDISVIQMTNRVSLFNDQVRPVCLPNVNKRRPSSGTRAYTTGWGRVGTNKPGSDRLKEAKVRLISDRLCSRYYSSTPDSVLCVFNVTGSICKVM